MDDAAEARRRSRRIPRTGRRGRTPSLAMMMFVSRGGDTDRGKAGRVGTREGRRERDERRFAARRPASAAG